MIEKTQVEIDLGAALRDLQVIFQEVKNQNISPAQIGLTCRSKIQPSFADAVGGLYDFEEKRWKARESDFKYFHPAIEKTYFYDIYCKFQKLSGNRIGRVRIMTLASKACSTWMSLISLHMTGRPTYCGDQRVLHWH